MGITAQEIFENSKKRMDVRERITVEEWGCDIFIRKLRGVEIDALKKKQKAGATDVQMMAHYIVAGAENEDGERLFTVDSVPALTECGIDTLNFIATEIMILCKLIDRESADDGEGEPEKN